MLTFGEAASLVDGAWLDEPKHLLDATVARLAPPADAGPGEITFAFHARWLGALTTSRASAVLLSRSLESKLDPASKPAVLFCSDAQFAAAKLQQVLAPQPPLSQGTTTGVFCAPDADVHPSARLAAGVVIEPGAVVGANCVLGAQSYVGSGAHLGEGCVLHPGSKVLWACELKDRVILQAGAVVGSDGFGYAQNPRGSERIKMPQVGHVVIDDDVEIGANTTIDRATFGRTYIGKRTKIDNLVQIAHNVVIGADCVVVSQTGVAGSTTIADRVILGAQVGVVGHTHIASDVVLAARTGVAGAIDTPGIYAGAPALPHKQWLRAMVALKQLPEFLQRWRRDRRGAEAAQAQKS